MLNNTKKFKRPNISLYINIPKEYSNFINKKNFFLKKNKYLTAIIKDFKKNFFLLFCRPIFSLFISLKTTFLIPFQEIKYLIKNFKNFFSKKNIEITIEIFPQKINYQNLIKYFKIGINRISLNIKTFNKKILKKFKWSNFSKKSLNILFKKKIIKNFNIDLQYGIPTQTLKNVIKDLKKTLKYNPTHITWTLYSNSFSKNKNLNFKIPTPSEISKMSLIGHKILTKYGYKKYEISSYAKPKYQCQHNLNYWTFQDYLGLGCKSHSKITIYKFKILRLIKHEKILNYIQKLYLLKFYYIKKNDIVFEFFLNISFLFKKISYLHFKNITHHSILSIKKKLKKSQKKGFLIFTKKNIIITSFGYKNLFYFLDFFLN